MKRTKAWVTGWLLVASFAACDKDPVGEQNSESQLTLSHDSVVVKLSESSPLNVTVRNASGVIQQNASVKFVSRDPGVANVNASGLISGVAVGATYVVASVTDRPEVRDSVRVRVFTEPPKEIPLTGAAVPGMESYDSIFSNFLRKHSIPGGTVAVMRDGKLIYARGFGYADVEAKTLAQPDALFRIASMSKPITSAAIFKLIEEGKLELDAPIAQFITDLAPAPGASVDPRWDQITIGQLLSHSGGWDRGKPGGFDPVDRTITAANVVGAPVPGSPETLIRYMKGIPLDFNPGEKFAYSNFGFAILGVIIQRVTGMPYEDYVRSRVLLPVGATRTRSGKSRLSDALPEEVKYYFPGFEVVNAPLVPSVFPGEGAVPFNYGGFHLEVSFASGAWVSSTIDLLRFLGGVDGRANRPDILSAASITQMTSASNGAQVCGNGACYYSGGWFVRPMASGATWWHGGTLPGSTGMLVRTSHDFAMVAVFNSRAPSGSLELEIYDALWNGLEGVTSFPTHDLFSTFR